MRYNYIMKIKYLTLVALLFVCISAVGQVEKVQNKPYSDLRLFHFGVLVGTHLQDIELQNVGLQQITREDGTSYSSLVSVEQDRWDVGFQVGVLGELRLNTHLQLRVAPAMFFGTRNIRYLNVNGKNANGKSVEQLQDIKTAYVSMGTQLIYGGMRVNNHRPYLMVGLNPMLNLSGRDNDLIKLKRYDAFAEIGFGCDFYLPFFKLRPEIKFMYGLTNAIDNNHINKVTAQNMVPYTRSTRSAHTKIVALTFYFE